MGWCMRAAKQRHLLVRRRAARSQTGRLATPASKTLSMRNSRKAFGAALPQRVMNLSPIDESLDPGQRENVIPDEGLRDPPPQSCQTAFVLQDSVGEHTVSCSTNCDSSSDMDLPSGVSTFFLDCMDSGSCVSSSSSSSHELDSSYSSPEVFRTPDMHAETLCFTMEEEFVELQVKNSTLLDVSHAVDINMRQPLNLSAIMENSRRPDEKDLERRHEILNASCSFTLHRTTVSGSIRQISLSERKLQPRRNAEVCAPVTEPQKIGRARPMMCRKKVSFQSAAGKEPERRAAEARGLTVAQMAQNDAPGTHTGPDFSAVAQRGDEGPAGIYMVDLDEDEYERGLAEDTGAVPDISAQRNARVFHFTDEDEKNAVLKKRERPRIVFPSRPLIPSTSPTCGEIRPVYMKFHNSEVHDPEELHEVCWMQLLQEGEDGFNSSRFKRILTNEGVIYEDYGKIRQYEGQCFQ
ncbi:uncharacterized protein [Paramormyrops kingsleyae]|uniref:uncharacterized protein isoform X2 n=1 Tax=Paramormyrops kingsleyae TaxID=1676925 RepID=UPI000CD5F65B|nr:uncharacterized protein LOC111839555 isoform X2 [Paramormyrops kingsleyae]